MSEAQEAGSKKKTEYFPVTMEDGSVFEFAGKRKMEKERIIERDGSGAVTKLGVKFRFRHGGIVTSWIPDSMIADAATHGWAQKLGDTVAGLKDEHTKEPAGPDDMQVEVEGLHERLSAPGANWNEVREGGGFGGASILMKALILYTADTDAPRSPEQVKDFLKKKSATEKMALRDKPSRANKAGKTLQDIIAVLEAEKKSKVSEVDTDALMGELATA